MAGRRAGLAARLAAVEQARGAFRMHFRTSTGRTFSLDAADVLSIAMDCLTWLHTEDTDQPRGRIVEQLADAEPHNEQGLILQTAIAAARQAVTGVRP